MTTRQEQLFTWGARLGSVVIAATVAWVMLSRTVSDIERVKLDAYRFERDSARRDNRWVAKDSTDARSFRILLILLCDTRPEDTLCRQARQAIPLQKDGG